jgi:hypothetical protein
VTKASSIAAMGIPAEFIAAKAIIEMQLLKVKFGSAGGKR